MLPVAVLGSSRLNKSELCHCGGDGVASCHGVSWGDDVMGCPRRGGGSVLPPADGAGGNLIGVYLSELRRPYGGRDAHGVDHRGVLIPGGAIVTVGDPDGLAVSEAGSRGEAHWLVGCLLR